MSDELYLVKIPVRMAKLAAFARRRGLPTRDFDDGYIAHCVLRELWQEKAPTPFVLRAESRSTAVWGYGRFGAETLIEHASAFGDPALVAIIEDLAAIASRTVPLFERERRVGFCVRACPTVRLSKSRNGHEVGAEVDAFLARCFELGKQVKVSREAVYQEWLDARMADATRTGARLESARVVGFGRERFVRRTQGEHREARRLVRPEVWFEGDLTVIDGERFVAYLAHGVGRHRAFGFGALMLMPPGATVVPVGGRSA